MFINTIIIIVIIIVTIIIIIIIIITIIIITIIIITITNIIIIIMIMQRKTDKPSKECSAEEAKTISLAIRRHFFSQLALTITSSILSRSAT